MGSKIREATAQDIGSCLRLFEIGSEAHPIAYSDLSPDLVVENIHQGRVLVGEAEGMVVGMISALPTPNKTILYMLVVDKNHRKQTLAPELISAAADKYGQVMALVVPHAVPSFEKAGMRQTAFVLEN